MTTSPVVNVLFYIFGAGAILTAYLVFRTDSMVRAAYWLLASFAGVGAILVLLQAEFLGLVLMLMMAGEMTIMAFVMVMFMMNPAGLNPMVMVHQHKTAIAAGIAAFLALSGTALATDFPTAPVQQTARATEQLGTELLGESMLVFETAGVALLATMIGAVAVSSRRGRYGDAAEDSIEPGLQPDEELEQSLSPAEEEGGFELELHDHRRRTR
jgi:NADH-quinone oxidoreductase subunit J